MMILCKKQEKNGLNTWCEPTFPYSLYKDKSEGKKFFMLLQFLCQKKMKQQYNTICLFALVQALLLLLSLQEAHGAASGAAGNAVAVKYEQQAKNRLGQCGSWEGAGFAFTYTAHKDLCGKENGKDVQCTRWNGGIADKIKDRCKNVCISKRCLEISGELPYQKCDKGNGWRRIYYECA